LVEKLNFTIPDLPKFPPKRAISEKLGLNIEKYKLDSFLAVSE
jgi:hypothetical protein